jgi:class 3 adenylate cyclase
MKSADFRFRSRVVRIWASLSNEVNKLQFTFTFQVTLALVVSFVVGNYFLYQAASNRLYLQQEKSFRDHVLYLSNVILLWEKSIQDTMRIVALNPSVRSLDPQGLSTMLTPLMEQTPLRRWKVWGADGKLLLTTIPITNIRLTEKRNLKNVNFQKALSGSFNYGVNSVLSGARLEGCLEASYPIPSSEGPVSSPLPPAGVLSFCLPFSKVGADSGMIKVDQINLSETEKAALSNQNSGDDGLIEVNRGRYNGRIFFLLSSTGRLVFPTVSNGRFDHVSLLSPDRVKSSQWHPFVAASLDPSGLDKFRKVQIDGYSYFLYSHRVSDQWTAVSIVDTDTVYAPLRRTLFQLMLVQGLSLLVTSIAIYFVCRQLTKPLRAVVQTVSDLSDLTLASKQPVSLSSSSIVEVRQVSQAINRLSFAMDSFGRYLPREVVRSVLASNQSARLGGDVRELVILFTDIKDFTSYSETMESSALLKNLNHYLSALTSAILETSGTIDKYIGDSIMAFWGAPAPLLSPATLACAAALAIRRETARINQEWRDQGLDLCFETRVGVNLGQAIVGNVGSEERFNYTVIGDSVNLASRLESTNKLYGTDILVSRSIVDAVAAEGPSVGYVFRLLDRVNVKGKAQSSDIYELLDTKDQFSHDDLRDLETANEIMARTLDFGENEGLRLLSCLPEENKARQALVDLRELLELRLQLRR